MVFLGQLSENIHVKPPCEPSFKNMNGLSYGLSDLVVGFLNVFLSGSPRNPQNVIEILLMAPRSSVEEMRAENNGTPPL